MKRALTFCLSLVLSFAISAVVVSGVQSYLRRSKPTVIAFPPSPVFTPPIGWTHPSNVWDPPELEPPADHPPLKLVIGASVYSVHYTNQDWLESINCLAYTSYFDHAIWFMRGGPSPRRSMMHELLHISKHEARIEDDLEGLRQERTSASADSHRFIVPVAPQLLKLLRQNPKLVAWLIDVRHPEADIYEEAGN